MANNLSIKLNLAKLDGASLQTNPNTGKRAMIIPVEEADLFVSDRGGVYLDLSAWENRDGIPDQYGNTYGIKKSYSKEVRERLGKDGIKAKPFIGNAKPIPVVNNNVQGAASASSSDFAF